MVPEPPVSEPSDQATKPAATGSAGPLLDPPGTRVVSQGLLVLPNAEFSPELPIANSSQFARPTDRIPTALRRLTTVGVIGATGKFSKIFEAQDVIRFCWQILSLIIPGIPHKGLVA